MSCYRRRHLFLLPKHLLWANSVFHLPCPYPWQKELQGDFRTWGLHLPCRPNCNIETLAELTQLFDYDEQGSGFVLVRIWRRGQKRGKTFCSYVLTSLPKKRCQHRDSVYGACTSLRLIFLPQAPGAWTRVTDMHYHAWLIKFISLDTVGK